MSETFVVCIFCKVNLIFEKKLICQYIAPYPTPFVFIEPYGLQYSTFSSQNKEKYLNSLEWNGKKIYLITNSCMSVSIFVFANNFSINDDSAGTLSNIALSCCSLQSESCETAIIPYCLNN